MLRSAFAVMTRPWRLARLARKVPQHIAAEQDAAKRRLIAQARTEWS